MRILWLTVDRSHRIAQQFDIFRSHVKKIADVVELKKSINGNKGQDMWQLSRNLINGKTKIKNIVINYLKKDKKFDFIFCDAFFAYLDEDWKSFGIPSGILIEDVHQAVPRHQIEKAKEYGIENLFHRFNFAFHTFHPKARRDFNCFWLPHSIDTTKFKPLDNKELDVLHVGVCPKTYYPHRADAVRQLKNKEYFKQIIRPKEGGDRTKKWPIDTDYAKLVASAKICITGGSIFNAPVQKYVEIPACNTLLMSNWFPDLGLLGFVPGLNMISYNSESLIALVEGLLNDDYKLKEISANGYKLITTEHSSIKRSKQFINNICQILRIDKEFPDINACSFQVNFNISDPVVIDRPKPKPKKSHKKAPIKIDGIKKVTGTDWRSRII